ncbi:hypothetical protein KUTeg_020711 [Tegillarca granosa]|uniref:Uncharacterized protein n=1 Tax=Tegillarca granosa TaxID=220873 RepID=A0ABQ9EB87_TEGGR|nr:hypothetical protein KUTeg_020711 [Tegillarca granosa]
MRSYKIDIVVFEYVCLLKLKADGKLAERTNTDKPVYPLRSYSYIEPRVFLTVSESKNILIYDHLVFVLAENNGIKISTRHLKRQDVVDFMKEEIKGPGLHHGYRIMFAKCRDSEEGH